MIHLFLFYHRNGESSFLKNFYSIPKGREHNYVYVKRAHQKKKKQKNVGNPHVLCNYNYNYVHIFFPHCKFGKFLLFPEQRFFPVEPKYVKRIIRLHT